MEHLRLVLQSLYKKHSEFFKLFVKAMMFTNHQTSSLLSVLVLIYFVHALRRVLDRFVVLRIYCLSGRICREILFHIAYYYFTIAWFYLMKAIRTLTDIIVLSVKGEKNDEEVLVDLRTILSIFYTLIFTLIFVTAVIYERIQPEIHYFTWITRPRWLETEIGTSARLLVVEEQIPRIDPNETPAYRSQRSASTQVIKRTISRIPRYTQSEIIKTHTSVSKLVEEEM